MNEISPNDKHFGGIFLDDTGLYCIYPDTGKKRVNEIKWYKQIHALEIVEYRLPNEPARSLVRYAGDAAHENILKNALYVKPVRAEGDVFTLIFDDRESHVDSGLATPGCD